MIRLRIDCAYDGTTFSGWQSQADRHSIQDLIEEAIAGIAGHKVRIHGAGRTDAGVHALGQVAHFDLETNRLPVSKWPTAINARLPPEIRVLRCREVPGKFHARFSATGKIYRYELRLGKILPPFERDRVWLVPGKVDLGLFGTALGLVKGRHDFRAFAANRGRPEPDTVREIYVARLIRRGARVSLLFCGDGFLYRMVRLLVGGMVRVAAGRMPLETFRRLLNPEPGEIAKCAYCAPACGLTLVRVLYSSDVNRALARPE